MKLIVGLGNPGKKYERARHNLGFMAIDKISEKLAASNFKEKFSGLISETNFNNEKVILLKPQTFMNLSGDSIIQILNFYKIHSESEMLVIYDDMSLPVGKLRIRRKGSAGGHNGIKSIISHVGENFLRVKVGIGKNIEKDKTIDFVLGNFFKEEEKAIEDSLLNIFELVVKYLKGEKIENIMQIYNKKN